jgi:hypothetical protein
LARAGENADATNLCVPLGDGIERPHRRRATEQGDELAPSHHSIASSARC